MTEDKQEAILRKVRALMAKAASTTWEEERKSFMAKADELMEKYAISRVLAMQADDPRVKLVIRKMMDFNWWRELSGIDSDARSSIYWLWMACVRHCRAVTPGYVGFERIGTEYTIPVYGTESDLAYLDLLFTDLFMQMAAKLKPDYDPDKPMGENIAIAKQAGMKYADIAIWMGRPEWVKGGRPVDHGIMARAYKQYVASVGDHWITTSPKSYQWAFVESFCSTIQTRLHYMRENRESPQTGSMEIALRDIREQAMEEMYQDFPSMRPHPAGCTCEQCSRRRKPVKYRERRYSAQGSALGKEAGQAARIVTNDAALRDRKKLT